VILKLDNGPTTNQDHVIPIITILGTNHFCLKRIYHYGEQSLIHEIRSV
jgi:hypothetical protein